MTRRAGLRPAEILALLHESDCAESDCGELSDKSESDFEVPPSSSESSGDESVEAAVEHEKNTSKGKWKYAK